MNQQEMNIELKGQLSAAEAELAGAFEEDALDLQAAEASVGDEALSPEAMQAAPRMTSPQ